VPITDCSDSRVSAPDGDTSCQSLDIRPMRTQERTGLDAEPDSEPLAHPAHHLGNTLSPRRTALVI
jgi:hypothetical protein